MIEGRRTAKLTAAIELAYQLGITSSHREALYQTLAELGYNWDGKSKTWSENNPWTGSAFGIYFEQLYLANLVKELNKLEAEYKALLGNPNATHRETYQAHVRVEAAKSSIAFQCKHMLEQGLLEGGK